MNKKEEKSNCKYCNGEISKYNTRIDKKGFIHVSQRLNKFCGNECYKCFKIEESLPKKMDKVKKFNLKLNKNSTIKTNTIYKDKLCPSCNKIHNGNKQKCKECYSQKYEIYYKERSKKDYESKHIGGLILKRILVHISGGKCTICGYNDKMASLVFHHKNPEDKKFTVNSGSLFKNKIENILIEHEKCDLLCHNCHAALHQVERLNKTTSDRYKKTRELYQQRKMELISRFDNKCDKCGFIFNHDNSQVASFNHLRDKEFEINSLTLVKPKKYDIESEILKCELLCMNCHIAMNSKSDN